jgi:hypothetical protein
MNERAPVIVDITIIGMVKYAFLLVNNLQDSVCSHLLHAAMSPLNQYLFVFVRPTFFSIKVSSVSFISLTGRGLLHEAILLYQNVIRYTHSVNQLYIIIIN